MSARLTRARVRIVSPLHSWFRDGAALGRFRRRWLGRAAVVLRPRDDAWRSIAPDFATAVDMAASGLPFHVAAERRYDHSADPRRLDEALASGATVYLPQVHQVLPRLARIIVALRATLLGPSREESSFLFLVEGRGRRGMGLHHDGDVDSFWIQLEGRRTITVGPPVKRGAPADLDDRRGPGWWTRDLEPGTLFYMPARTPHDVICRERSLAITLTWGRRQRRARDGLLQWDVVSGHVADRPERSPHRWWTQVPAAPGPVNRQRQFTLWTMDGGLTLPVSVRALAQRLIEMPSFSCEPSRAAELRPFVEHGIVGDEDLPLRILPEDVRSLDGWRFGSEGARRPPPRSIVRGGLTAPSNTPQWRLRGRSPRSNSDNLSGR